MHATHREEHRLHWTMESHREDPHQTHMTDPMVEMNAV